MVMIINIVQDFYYILYVLRFNVKSAIFDKKVKV